MDNLDTKTLIHVGTELLLIGGLGFWMKGKIGAAETRIEELEKRLAAYEQIFSGLQGALVKHENMLRQMNGMPLLPISSKPSPEGPPVPANTSPVPKENVPLLKDPHPVPPVRPQVPKEAEEDSFSSEDLDKILNEELGEEPVLKIDTAVVTEKALKSKRKKVSSSKKKVD